MIIVKMNFTRILSNIFIFKLGRVEPSEKITPAVKIIVDIINKHCQPGRLPALVITGGLAIGAEKQHRSGHAAGGC